MVKLKYAIPLFLMLALCTAILIGCSGVSEADAKYSHTQTVEIPVGNFQYVGEATHTDGNGDNYCDSCGTGMGCAHANTTPYTETSPTCTETGLGAGQYCEDCDTWIDERETIAALGHTLSMTAAKAATCTDKGNSTYYTCSTCKQYYLTNDTASTNNVTLASVEIAAKGHTKETIIGTPATCIATGLTDGEKCSVCGVTTVAQTTINALGHKEVALNAVAATCTTSGLTAGKKCSTCETVTVAQTTISATGHSMTKNKQVSAATCTAAEVRTYYCATCGADGDNYTGQAKLGHNYQQTGTTAATCTAQGYTSYKCSKCSSTKNDNYTSPLGHSNTTSKISTTQHQTICSRCNASSTAGHNFGTQQELANNGHSVYKCKGCGWDLLSKRTACTTGDAINSLITTAGGHNAVGGATNIEAIQVDMSLGGSGGWIVIQYLTTGGSFVVGSNGTNTTVNASTALTWTCVGMPNVNTSSMYVNPGSTIVQLREISVFNSFDEAAKYFELRYNGY